MPDDARPRRLRRALAGWGVAVALGGLVVVYLFKIAPYRRKHLLMSAFNGADKVVVWTDYGHGGERVDVKVTYTGAKVAEILGALRGAWLDRGVHDTPVGSYKIDVYRKDARLGTVPTCSGLFRFAGDRYRDRSGVIEKLVDSALNRKIEAGKRRAPEP